MSSKISDNEFAFFFFFQQWFTQLVRVLDGFFLFLRPIDGQRLDGVFRSKLSRTLFSDKSDPKSCQESLTASRPGGDVILSLGKNFFTRLFIIIIAHNCPLYLCNWCYDITTERNLYTRRVFFRAGVTNWTLLKWRLWLLSWRLSLFPYVTVSQLESIPWMPRSRLGCFLFNSSLYHIIKNQVLRKAEKFTILISYFHELWKLKSLPPVLLITAGERNSQNLPSVSETNGITNKNTM